ncbi:hypothetical protein MN116_007473 [Schistosoma mekongi]|uniref:C3H1-type domain-containing protein n=1 Tax=Schistosoma mekongi TaxID=38744 RepID=A0AAE2D3I4_SCHME|nr:hypothetical protein MN116_007473 [Schistosoma mekongi]
MVFETHDVLKCLSDMQRNLNTVRTTNTPLHELFTSNTHQEEKLLNTINYSPGHNTRYVTNQRIRSYYDPTDEFSTLPDNLKMIVKKTWKAYCQENIENIPPDVDKNMPRNISAICTCQASEVVNNSTKYPTGSGISSDSGLGFEQLLAMPDRKSLLQSHPPSQLQQHSEQTIKLKPRPLLRQKENAEPFSHEVIYTSAVTVANTSHVKTVTSSQSDLQLTSTTHRPMQVHMRYPIPRKQDAIYNARYKTQPCVHYQKHKHCPLGDNCHFAHGPDELKYPQFHPKYRTRVCLNYANSGNCPFGRNCYFLHSTPTSIQSNTLYDKNINQMNISNRTTISYWNIDNYLEDDNSITNRNSHMDTVALCSNLRRVTI